MTFLLTGFKHESSMRVYSFDRVEADRTRTQFTVGADLSLIRKYNIRVQDLPLLCRSVLEVIDGVEPPVHSLLSEQLGFAHGRQMRCVRRGRSGSFIGSRRGTGLDWLGGLDLIFSSMRQV